MEKIEVKINPVGESSYPIFIGKNLLNNLYDIIQKFTKASRFLIVTNDTVFSHYGEIIKNENAQFIILPDGEIYKNMDTLQRILNKCMELNLERKDAIIALGGGVIGDMAGFAASIYRRGIDFVQVPTTLLAMVDSSVGGKVAVNHSSGKNMIGAFYQPKAVIADTNTLSTLDDRQFKSGLGEILKYAFIEKNCACQSDFNFLEFLENHKNDILLKNTDVTEKMIKICCSLKASVVNKDEKEKGLRAILNFGHTFAHAIEKLTGYEKYTHGEAVSIGMTMIFNVALKLNFISYDYYNRCINLINDYSLVNTYSEEFLPEDFYNAMLSDKKTSGGRINFVIPTGEREVEIINNIDKNIVLEGI